MTPRATPFKIIQVFNRYLQPGGEENSVRRIAEDLEAGGHRVRRFWRASAEWKAPGAPSKLRQFFLMRRNEGVLRGLAQAHEEEQPDFWLLHNVMPVVSLAVYDLATRLNVPIVQWLHNFRPVSPSGYLFAGGRPLRPDDRWLALKETVHGAWNGRALTAWISLAYAQAKRRRAFDSVAAWVAVSESMRQLFLEANWFPDKLYALRHSWNRSGAPPSDIDAGFFLFLGRMVETKGVGFLIDLWRDAALQSVPLVMAGQGPLAERLRGSSPPAVKWIGHVEGSEKAKWLAECRAVLFPSAWIEPLSTIAYEAYERGKPILASDRGGMAEIVFERRTGRILPATNRQAWREAILELRDGSERARDWGAEGRRWLEANVSRERWLAEFNRIAAEALSRWQAAERMR